MCCLDFEASVLEICFRGLGKGVEASNGRVYCDEAPHGQGGQYGGGRGEFEEAG